jgi:S-formylglutathione hydrolase FrmB
MITQVWLAYGQAGLLSEAPGTAGAQGISLLNGWVPVAVQVVTAAAVLGAVGVRRLRRRAVWLSVALLIGLATALLVHWYVKAQGMTDDPGPPAIWIWTGLAGFAASVAVLGFRSAQWWRRGLSLLAVALCLCSAGLALNRWVGYFPTVQVAWNQLTAGPLPDQTDLSTALAEQRGNGNAVPATGAVVPVDIPDAVSHFRHRTEYVYLPPAWLRTSPPPRLPVILMIPGAFNTAADWIRSGDAVATADSFASAHGGYAPVLVFVDAGGSFNTDTECVNGRRGSAADHLTKDVVPFVKSTFGVAPSGSNWGVVGFSMGGTCAVGLVVKYPQLFSFFVDIGGDYGPNVGSQEQTTARLYGGDEAAWESFDPYTVMTKHGPYDNISGLFYATSADPSSWPLRINIGNRAGLAQCDYLGVPDGQSWAAHHICEVGTKYGVRASVVTLPGEHDWPTASQIFAAALPGMARVLGTPQAPPRPASGFGP